MAISRSTRVIATVAAACALALPTAVTPAMAQPPIPVDHLGRPTDPVLQQLEGLAENPNTPEKAASMLKRIVGFVRGDGKPGVDVPENAPTFTQFGWPSVAGNCIGGTNKAVGTAMAVPGPAPLPLPGIGKGQVNFVFTALGTGTVAEHQSAPMRVHWLNANTGRTGVTHLGFTGINAEGPATVNGVGDTGSGTIFALLEGGVTTDEGEGVSGQCNFTPTAAIIQVP